MSRRKKLAPAIATGCLAVGLLGPGAGSASAATVTLQTGINSPNGTQTVVLPDAATPGALNAVSNVVTKGPGVLSNLTVTVSP